MAKTDPHLHAIIDSKKLREDLTALTADNDGDGSDSKIRSQALALLKETSKSGRQKVEALLLEDGSGSQCARRLSHLQDEIIRCLYDFAIVHVFRTANLSSGERMAIICVGGYGRGTLAPGSDLDLLFLLPSGMWQTESICSHVAIGPISTSSLCAFLMPRQNFPIALATTLEWTSLCPRSRTM